MAKYTSEDIERLAQEMRLAKDRQRPFAALIGAGCSVTAGIPSAAKLVEEIKRKYALRLKKLPSEKQSDYGACMGELLPSERKDILQPYLQNAKVNWANLAIAALLAKGYLARVLTFNFDQVLERACGIGGHYPAVYDFGVSPAETLDHVVEGSIIHLHGQSYGLTMMNSDEDTEYHARKLSPLIRQTLGRFPLLVLGYSAEADKVFPVLSSIYCDQTSENLVWCGYGESEPTHVRSVCSDCRGPSEFLGGVDADLFLIKLAQSLECWPPSVLFEPEAHLLNELASVIDYPAEEGGDDILKNIRSYLKEHESRFRPAGKIDFRRLLLEGKYDQIIAVKAEAKSDVENDAVAWAYITKGNALTELAKRNNDEALYNDSFVYFEAALAIKPDKHAALNNWGIALAQLATQKRDETLFKESFAKFKAALTIKPDDHDSLNNWGGALSEFARQMQNEAHFTESFSKFEAALAIKPDKHEALNNWGTALSRLAKQKQDVTLFTECFAKYEAALAVKPDKCEALNNYATALLETWHLTHEESLLALAHKVLGQLEALKPEMAYNSACLAALLGDETLCRTKLERCLKAGTLPDAKHLETDKDLESIHGKDWFQSLLEKRSEK